MASLPGIAAQLLPKQANIVEGQGKIAVGGKVQTAAKKGISAFSTLPTPIYAIIGGFLSADDSKVLPCISKSFKKVITSEAPTEATKRLLEIITGCISLTSLKTLRTQLRELKQFCPNHLGEGRPWTLAEVLRLYSLKTIDLSQEKLTKEDLCELMDAFLEIINKDVPKKTVIIERQAAVFAYQIRKIVEIRNTLVEMATRAGLFPQSSAIPIDYNILWKTVVCELIRKPVVEVAELLKDFPELLHPTEEFVTDAYEQNIFGDIEVFNLGLSNPSVGFIKYVQPFLEAFCPRLKIFKASYSEVNAPLSQFFATTHRKDTLTCLEISGNMWTPCQLFGCQRNLEVALKCLPISEYAELSLLADGCPRITHLSLNAVPYRTMAKKEREFFVKELVRVADECPKIENLTLVEFYNEELINSFRFIGGLFENLKELTIFNTIDGLRPEYSIRQETLKSHLLDCPQLRSLEFIGDGFHWTNILLNDSFIALIPEVQPELEELTVDSSDHTLSNYAIVNLVKHCPYLVKLNLHRYREMLQKVLESVFQLRRLNKKLSDKSVSSADFLKEFKKLNKDIIESIYWSIAWHFQKNDPSFGRRRLEENIQILNRCRKSINLFEGNLLEQHIERLLFHIESRLVLKGDHQVKQNASVGFINKIMIENFQKLLQDKTLSMEQCLSVYDSITTLEQRKELAKLFFKNANIVEGNIKQFEDYIRSNIVYLRTAVSLYIDSHGHVSNPFPKPLSLRGATFKSQEAKSDIN